VAIDLVVEDEAWGDEAVLLAEAERVVAALVAEKPARMTPEVEFALVLSSDAAVQEINREHRGLDKPTNVLSFPIMEAGAKRFGPLLGDVIVARETVLREAAERSWPLDDYFAHMLVHGLLHLLGYDHQIDDEAERMERLEAAILKTLGIPDPHADPDADGNHNR
jgi:probable rRNA maturation factor